MFKDISVHVVGAPVFLVLVVVVVVVFRLCVEVGLRLELCSLFVSLYFRSKMRAPAGNFGGRLPIQVQS